MDDLGALRLDSNGAQLYPQALSELPKLRALADPALGGRSGVRIFGGEIAAIVLDGSLHEIATSLLGPAAQPVRAILFDKTEETNWSVAWHQDRTIAVRERREVAGYTPWSVKDGAAHVEPPFDVMRDMVTLRAHLDDCDGDNAPLLVALGSHRLGRVPTGEIQGTVADLDVARCLARAGDVWAYATTIIHASEPTRRPQRRRVLQVDFSASELVGGLEWLGIANEQ
jgi:ectoine hydroxylase-related dioxygenase (phytanoyl-CoA dioxygenase family)